MGGPKSGVGCIQERQYRRACWPLIIARFPRTLARKRGRIQWRGLSIACTAIVPEASAYQ